MEQCLKLLTDLQSVLNDLGSNPSTGSTPSDVPTLSPDALSVSQQQKISSILQLVTFYSFYFLNIKINNSGLIIFGIRVFICEIVHSLENEFMVRAVILGNLMQTLDYILKILAYFYNKELTCPLRLLKVQIWSSLNLMLIL